jgi:hypothetical protein
MQVDEFFLLSHSELPLTKNGKIDSKKLLEISQKFPVASSQQNTIEWLLSQYFLFSNQEVPSTIDVVSMEDRFIVNMGASSLEIVRLVETILDYFKLNSEESTKRR